MPTAPRKAQDWEYLTTPGHVWQARLDHFWWLGPLLIVTLALSIGWDFASVGKAAARINDARNDAPPTLWERMRAAPVDTLLGRTADVAITPRPTLNLYDLSPIPAGMPPADLESDRSWKARIAASIKALDAGESVPDCEPIDDLRDPWLHPDGSVGPLCRSYDGVHFVAQLVDIGNGRYGPPRPTLGAYREGDSGWTFVALEIGSFGRPNDVPNIPLDYIAETAIAAFPEIAGAPASRSQNEESQP